MALGCLGVELLGGARAILSGVDVVVVVLMWLWSC